MHQIIGLHRKANPQEVRVIDSDGKQMGILPTREALRRADEVGLDLVCVQPKSKPPVCKIIDHGKFKYDKKKAEKEAKKKQHIVEMKEIKFRPKIGDHDFEVKLNKILKFLEAGNRVKTTVMFRGRENIHKDIGVEILKKVLEKASEVGQADGKIVAEGRMVFMMLSPTASKK